jgi:hypothetical protein
LPAVSTFSAVVGILFRYGASPAFVHSLASRPDRHRIWRTRGEPGGSRRRHGQEIKSARIGDAIHPVTEFRAMHIDVAFEGARFSAGGLRPGNQGRNISICRARSLRRNFYFRSPVAPSSATARGADQVQQKIKPIVLLPSLRRSKFHKTAHLRRSADGLLG